MLLLLEAIVRTFEICAKYGSMHTEDYLPRRTKQLGKIVVKSLRYRK